VGDPHDQTGDRVVGKRESIHSPDHGSSKQARIHVGYTSSVRRYICVSPLEQQITGSPKRGHDAILSHITERVQQYVSALARSLMED
jgi:hypothetical protein